LFLGGLLTLTLTGCGNNDDPVNGPDVPTIDQNTVKAKIGAYYSTPSSPTAPVPNVEAAFREKFPTATDVEWKVSNGVYEIDFEVDRVDYEAWYDADANLLMYKHDIAATQIPAAVSAALGRDYPGYRVDDVEKVYKGNIVGYYFDLEKGQMDARAFYQEDGTFLSTCLWEDATVKPTNNSNTETPPVDGSLTDAETDALIAAYYSSYDRDVPASNVPAAIRNSFTTLFPTARDIDWDLSREVYKTDFEINNVDYDAWYTQEGTLLAYKFDITRSTLPQAVRNAIARDFNGFALEDAEKVVKPHSTGYYVEVERGNMEYTAYYAEDGTYIASTFYQSGGTPPAQNGGGQNTNPTPDIPADGDYTDAEIDQMLQAFNSQRDEDVRPSQVPAAIQTAFGTQFPNSRDIEWDRAAGVYNADFEIQGADYEAWYATDGTLLMYTAEVWYGNVPAAVTAAVSAKYNNHIVDGYKFFQKGTQKGYLVEVEHRMTEAEFVGIFLEDGTFVSQQRD
jgi:hypothetical protein